MDGSIIERQARAYRSKLRVLEAAREIVEKHGWAALSFKDVASAADLSVGLVCRHFPTKDHFALAIYDQLAEELLTRADDLPTGSIVERFAVVMRWKLALCEPHRAALTALAGVAIDPTARAGVLSDASEIVRAKVGGLFELVVRGADDAPLDGSERIARLLYAAHLLLVLLWVQLPSGASLPIDEWARLSSPIAPALELAAQALDPTMRSLFGGAAVEPERRADAVLDIILRRRRGAPGTPDDEAAMRALHRQVVQVTIDRGGPVQLVLPAFPAKAPNREKVLGKAPDMAEWLALRSLAELLDQIAAVHPPGAELVICSDGGVFADLVGVSDADVRAYRRQLDSMLDALEAPLERRRMRLFDLDDAFGARSAPAARARLLDAYGTPTETLANGTARSNSRAAMVDGIHRFLFEDEIVRCPEESRTQARKRTRERAYEVVQRSESWGALVAAAFPKALRLSIHPQPAVSNKLGIHLIDTDDAWLTPWHGAAVMTRDGFRLMRRHTAEASGAIARVSEDGLAYLEIES